jgi:imidazolonepropionase-like amidohydrolase
MCSSRTGWAGGAPAALAGLTVVAVLVVVVMGAAQVPRAPSHPPLVLVGGMLIDGTGAAPRRNDAILLVGGRITRMGREALEKAPRDARVVDLDGRWILPGLIDGHVHLFQTGGLDARPDVVPHPEGKPYTAVVEAIRRNPQPYLRAYVCAGVTSVVDFGGPMWVFGTRDSREEDPLAPRMAFSGPLLATYDPKPLELENDDPIWLMKDAAGIEAQVARIAERRPELIKIWFVSRRGDDLDAQAALVREAIRIAHARQLRAAVHATTVQTARIAVAAGADILVHSVSDAEIDDALVEQIVRRRVIYVPTLIVGQSYRQVRLREVEVEPFERECAPPATVASFDVLPELPESALPRPAEPPPSRLPIEQRNLKKLVEAGAIVAAGTDAGNTRTLHGPSLHREFVLMAEAGLTPMQILVSATANGARLMGREAELGRIAVGYRADLLVLDADPLADIRHTRRTSMVIRGGSVYHP